MPAATLEEQGSASDWCEVERRLGPLAGLFSEVRLRVSSADACRALELSSRTALNRELAERKLPPFRLLKNWYQVWRMVHLAETGGGSLCTLALHGGEYPAAWYRMVKSTTGYSWCDVRERGSDWVMRCALQAWEPYTRMRTR